MTPPSPPFTKSIPDLYIAAYLKTRGCYLEASDRKENGRIFFTFSHDQEIDPLVAEYKSGKPVTLVPSDLMNALRELKAIIHDA